MGKIAVEVKDTVVEAKLETFLESCFSRSNNSMHVGHLFGQLLRNKSEEESLDTIEGMLEVAASVAFKRKLSSLACERYPKERSAESVGLSQEIVNDLVGEIVTRSVRQAISEIASAISKKDAAATLVAVNKATEAAKKLCDRFFFVEENFENEKVTRLTFEKFVSNPYAFERARTKNNEKDNSSGASRGGWEMISLSNAIAKGSFFAKVFVHFPKVDDKQLALDKAVYGAKGANLLALKKASETIQSFMEKIGEAFTVPDFTLIPVTAYDADRNDLSKNQELKNAYEWVRGRRVMIRSSALHSEDGEHLGAGGSLQFRNATPYIEIVFYPALNS